MKQIAVNVNAVQTRSVKKKIVVLRGVHRAAQIAALAAVGVHRAAQIAGQATVGVARAAQILAATTTGNTQGAQAPCLLG